VLGGKTADRRVVAEHLAHQAVAAAEVVGAASVACEALDVAARCARSRSLDDAADALLRALRHAESSDLALWRLRALNELGTVDMLRAADGSRLRRAHDEALRLGSLDIAVGIAVNIAALHAMRGELDETAAAAEQAEADALTLGLGPLAAAANVMRALSDGFLGRRDAMERRLARAEQLAPDDADLRAFAWGAGRGMCALVREERDDAIAALRRAVQTSAPVGSLDTGRGPLLLVLAASGDKTDEHLSAAIDTATPGAGWSELWVGYGHAAVVGHTGNGAAAAGLFTAAEPGAHRHPLFRAIGLRLLAEAALRDGWGEPVDWLRQAEATFVAGGQDRIASACRRLLTQTGAPAVRRRGADRALPAILLRQGVTAREAEVLELIGERLGNKDIAARLFLSPRTVEKHVASLLIKLDAPDRGRLGEVARSL
jgi:DNA-binding CsgD family transcriptional regulator